MAVIVQDTQVLVRGRCGDEGVLERHPMAIRRRQRVQRIASVTDDTPGQRHLSERIEFSFKNLEVA